MLQMLAIFISFVLMVLIGGKIVQTRQQQSWLAQQRFSGEEKEYFELKNLCDEIASSLGSRIYAMQRLVFQLLAHAQHGKFDQTAVIDYRSAITSWNQNINSYFVRLSQLKLSKFGQLLESELHNPMRKQSDVIDRFVRSMEKQADMHTLSITAGELERINKASFAFNKSLLREVHLLRTRIYFPERIILTRMTMHYFSNWMLIKALFVMDINRISIIRSPLDT